MGFQAAYRFEKRPKFAEWAGKASEFAELSKSWCAFLLKKSRKELHDLSDCDKTDDPKLGNEKTGDKGEKREPDVFQKSSGEIKLEEREMKNELGAQSEVNFGPISEPIEPRRVK